MRRRGTLAWTLIAGGCFSPDASDPNTTGTAASTDGSGSSGPHGTSSDATSDGPGGDSSGDAGSSEGTGSGDDGTTEAGSTDGGGSTGEPVAVCGDGVAAVGELCFDDITLVDGSDVMFSGRLADLDGDGDRDVVYLIGDGVVVHLGVGDGSFGPGLGGITMVSIAAEIGDVDGDGNTDIVGVNEYDSTVSIARGNGGGGFAIQPLLTANNPPSHLLITQLDGDDGDDIIVGTSMGVEVLRSTGDGAPLDLGGFGLGGPVHAMGLGEFDGDGDTDLIYVYEAYGEQRLIVRLGNGDASFGSSITIDDGGDLPRGVSGGDLDGDGHGDLVYVDVTLAQVFVQLGNGAGGFADPVGYTTDDDPQHTLLLDVTGDDAPDVVVGHVDGQSLWVYPGDGDGGLQPPLAIPLAGPVYSLASGYANADAIPDLVATDGGAQRISVVLSTP
ncbi:MAG: VCBS repeat-containing protein [Deltaproteobacteria bacterium]|nr:VCBS repeat-containing protein [Deltaproteobacteria bacterium]MBP7287697.1 VCBS repeat-containing protein [Nannocystaceae bacterium]